MVHNCNFWHFLLTSLLTTMSFSQGNGIHSATSSPMQLTASQKDRVGEPACYCGALWHPLDQLRSIQQAQHAAGVPGYLPARQALAGLVKAAPLSAAPEARQTLTCASHSFLCRWWAQSAWRTETNSQDC